MIRVLFFASLRERLGTGELSLPAEGLQDVAAVRAALRARGAVWSDHLDERQAVLAAVNQTMAQAETPVQDNDEVAFFPPVTGG